MDQLSEAMLLATQLLESQPATESTRFIEYTDLLSEFTLFTESTRFTAQSSESQPVTLFTRFTAQSSESQPATEFTDQHQSM